MKEEYRYILKIIINDKYRLRDNRVAKEIAAIKKRAIRRAQSS